MWYNGGMKSKVLQNKEEKREKLLAAAFKLMTSRNIQDISIAELAKEAGVAKGTFYLYFKDKYDLQDFLVSIESARIISKAEQELSRNDIRDFEDAIVFFINQILLQLESNPIALNFIKRNLSFGVFHSHISETFKEDSHHLLDMFLNRSREAGYTFEHPELVFFMILELTSSICYNSIVLQFPAPLYEIKPELFNAIRGILHQGMKTAAPNQSGSS